jgi:NUMOD3 motif
MNHQKIYEAIIQNAKLKNRSRKDNIYYEDHHIVPRCLNGSDNVYNRVLLTAREHFVCHKLLTYIYKGNYKIYNAFHLMTFMNKRKYGLTSRDYAYARELFNLIPKNHNGEKNPMFGKKQRLESIEKNKKSQPYTSVNFPQWLRNKIGEKSKGKNNAMFGKSFYDIWVIKYGKEIADKKLEDYKNNKKNKIRIRNNENVVKVIKQEDLEKFLYEGWEVGGKRGVKHKIPRSEECKKIQSIKRKEYWKRKKHIA